MVVFLAMIFMIVSNFRTVDQVEIAAWGTLAAAVAAVIAMLTLHADKSDRRKRELEGHAENISVWTETDSILPGEKHRIIVLNGSTNPIYDVAIGPFPAEGGIFTYYQIGTISPGQKKIPNRSMFESIPTELEIEFLDRKGDFWIRRIDGKLRLERDSTDYRIRQMDLDDRSYILLPESLVM